MPSMITVTMVGMASEQNNKCRPEGVFYEQDTVYEPWRQEAKDLEDETKWQAHADTPESSKDKIFVGYQVENLICYQKSRQLIDSIMGQTGCGQLSNLE